MATLPVKPDFSPLLLAVENGFDGVAAQAAPLHVPSTAPSTMTLTPAPLCVRAPMRARSHQ